MADVRESFGTLEGSSGEGLVLAKVLEGDAIGGNAATMLVAKDNSGDLKYLEVDASGALSVTMDGAGTCKSATVETPVAGSASKTTLADVTLTVAKIYRKLEWSVCNFRDTIYTMEVIDDPAGTPAIVKTHTVIVGPGDYTDSGELHCFEFDTTGLTDPVLRLSGQNLNSTSDFRGTIAITEDNA